MKIHFIIQTVILVSIYILKLSDAASVKPTEDVSSQVLNLSDSNKTVEIGNVSDSSPSPMALSTPTSTQNPLNLSISLNSTEIPVDKDTDKHNPNIESISVAYPLIPKLSKPISYLDSKPSFKRLIQEMLKEHPTQNETKKEGIIKKPQFVTLPQTPTEGFKVTSNNGSVKTLEKTLDNNSHKIPQGLPQLKAALFTPLSDEQIRFIQMHSPMVNNKINTKETSVSGGGQSRWLWDMFGMGGNKNSSLRGKGLSIPTGVPLGGKVERDPIILRPRKNPQPGQTYYDCPLP